MNDGTQNLFTLTSNLADRVAQLEENQTFGPAVIQGYTDGLNDRVAKLEGSQKLTAEALVESISDLQNQLLLTIRMVKDTIRAVERLAKGKSLGALGLPMEEQWDPPV